MGKILHLTLKKEWFDKILSGQKKIEYRDIKPYWQKRLLDEKGNPLNYDFIIFKNGYGKNVPTMKVEFVKLIVSDKYEIHLGKTLEALNVR